MRNFRYVFSLTMVAWYKLFPWFYGMTAPVRWKWLVREDLVLSLNGALRLVACHFVKLHAFSGKRTMTIFPLLAWFLLRAFRLLWF